MTKLGRGLNKNKTKPAYKPAKLADQTDLRIIWAGLSILMRHLIDILLSETPILPL